MNFKIHRGTKEIGGSCVEVWTDKTRLVLDIGMPLVNQDRTRFDANKIEKLSKNVLLKIGILPDIPSLYKKNSETFLLISHAHKDHYGLMKYINYREVWLGLGAKLLIDISNTVGDEKWKINNPNYFKHNKKITIGDIKVTPYLMDHSGFDAYAFLLEANGKSLFYSGDFRNHGRKKAIFDWFCKNFNKKVDYLLLEGSTLGRASDFPTEKDLELKFAEIFNKTKGVNLVQCSTQNIDRLVTIYNACKRTQKIFLIDFYTAYILHTLNKSSKYWRNIPHPSKNFPEIRVYCPNFLIARMDGLGKKEEMTGFFKDFMISKKALYKYENKSVMLVRSSCQYDVKKYLKNHSGGCFIYSMYRYDDDKKEKKFQDYLESTGCSMEKDIHTSGHADLETLKKIVKVIKPKHLVPIHTFEAKEYEKHFPNVLQVDDKQEVRI